MKQTNGPQALEQVSALADGQLHGEAFAVAVSVVSGSDELRANWWLYHVVGDVLRSGAHVPCSESGAFVAGLRERMAHESLARPRLPTVVEPEHATVVRLPVEAANAPVFRWKVVAGLATVAAAAAIGWTWIGQSPAAAPGAQLAQQQAPAPALPRAASPSGEESILAASATTSPMGEAPALRPTRVVVGNGTPGVMLRDPRLDELLQAHQQASGASQMPSGFLRNATFEAPSR